MICLWVVARVSDVVAYAAMLLLPAYLAHLELAPFEILRQSPVRDGREPLVLAYLGEGRLEQFALDPHDHALGLIQFLAPGIDTSRVQLPQDDAAWLWPAPDDGRSLRVHFFRPRPRCWGAASRNRWANRRLSPCRARWPS